MANIPKVWNGTAFIELEAAATVAPAASTSVVGIVQLTDSTSSTSTTTAATPNSVKSAYDLAGTAIPKNTVTTTGDILYASGSATVARLGIGTASQVLSVSAGVPAWTTPAASAEPTVNFTYWVDGRSIDSVFDTPEVYNFTHSGGTAGRWVFAEAASGYKIRTSGTASSAATAIPVLASSYFQGGTALDNVTALISDNNGTVVYLYGAGALFSSNAGSSFGTAATITGGNSAVFGGSVFVAVGSSGALWSSTNGSAWTSRTSGFSTSNIFDVAYDGTRFIAVGGDGKSSQSTDGVTWSANTAVTRTYYNGGTAAFFQVAANSSGTAVAIMGWNTARENVFYTTNGGTSWTLSDAPPLPVRPRGDRSSIVHDGTYFWIMAGLESQGGYPNNSDYLLRSTNGANWTVVPFGKTTGNISAGYKVNGYGLFTVGGELYMIPGYQPGNPTIIAKKI